MERVTLRHRAVCQICGSRLPPRFEAWWDAANERATCLTCYQLALAPTEPVEHAATTSASPPADAAVVQRSPSELDQRVVERLRSAVGRSEGERPAHTPLPAGPGPSQGVGGLAGSRRGIRSIGALGRTLEAANGRGVTTLHGRIDPATGEVIDHLAVAPNGLWIVLGLDAPSGKVEPRDLGDWFSSDRKLFVAGEDRSDVVARAARAVATVADWLAATPLGTVPRQGVICFDEVASAWMPAPFAVDDVLITTRKHLVEPMLGAVVYGESERAELARHLEIRFPPL